ncbi:MAG: DUF2125 domain-containing protein [Pseudomonadota bacterium]
MRGLGRVVMGAGLVLALGWSGLWAFARGQIEDKLDAGLDRIRAGGLAVEVGAKRVSGFPFSFAAEFEDVTFTDPATGLRTELPALATRVGLDSPGEIVTELPDRFTLTLPLDRSLRATIPGLPPRLTLELEGEEIALRLPVNLEGTPPRSGALTAKRLSIRPIDADLGTDFSLRMVGLDANGALGEPDAMPGGSVGLSQGRLSAAAFALEYTTSGGGEHSRVTLGLSNAKLGVESTAKDEQTLRRVLNGEPGDSGTLTLESGALDGALVVAGTGPTDGRLDASGRAFWGSLAIEKGGMETKGRLTAPEITLAPADASNPYRGGVTAKTLETTLLSPVAPGPQMRAVRMAATLEAFSPDTALWQRLDPESKLPRTPGRAAIEIQGTGRYTKPPGQMRPGEAVPLELGNLSLSTFELSGLGAAATGRGDVEFLQPVNEPVGDFTLQLTGALGLLRRLHEAGLISEKSLQSLATLAAFYTRAGDGPDKLVTDIAIAPGEIRVNGDRIR